MIKIGDKVKLSDNFLKSIQMKRADLIGQSTGEVVSLKEYGKPNLVVAHVKWSDDEITSALTKNLTLIGAK